MKKFLFLFIFIPITLHSQEKINLSLEDAYDLALNNSSEIRNMILEIEQNNYSYKYSIRSYFPEININYSESEEIQKNNQDTKSNSLVFGISQLIYDGGAQKRIRDFQRIHIKNQFNEKEYLVNKVKNIIYDNYFKIIFLQNKIEIKQQLQKIANKELDIIKQKYLLGSIIEIDYYKSLIQIKNIDLEILNLQSELNTMLFEYKSTLGLSNNIELNLIDILNKNYEGIELKVNKEKLYDLAIKRSIELKSKVLEIEESKQQYLMQEFLPKISLECNANFTIDSFPIRKPSINAKIVFSFENQFTPLTFSNNKQLLKKDVKSNSSSLNVNVLKDISFIYSKSLFNKALKEKLKDLEQIKNSIDLTIQSFFEQYDILQKTLNIYRESLSIQKRNFQIIEKQYKLGEITFNTFLEEQVNLNNYEIEVLTKVLELVLLEKNFEYSIGLENNEFELLNGAAK